MNRLTGHEVILKLAAIATRKETNSATKLQAGLLRQQGKLGQVPRAWRAASQRSYEAHPTMLDERIQERDFFDATLPVKDGVIPLSKKKGSYWPVSQP